MVTIQVAIALCFLALAKTNVSLQEQSIFGGYDGPFYNLENTDNLSNVEKPIIVAAIGRVARIAELYDARTDQFLRNSLIKNNSSSLILQTDNKNFKLKYLYSNSLEEKLKILNVQADVKLSVISDMIQLDGSGTFLHDRQQMSRSEKASVAALMTTTFDQLELSNINLVDVKTLQQTDATHVVVGTNWGGNVFISIEDTNYVEDQQSVKNNLAEKLELIVASLNGNFTANISSELENEIRKLSFEIYGDVLPKEVPTNLIDAVILMNNLPQLVTESNDGKGKQVSYTLLSINVYRKLVNSVINKTTCLKSIEDSTINAFVNLFDKINNVELRINDLILDHKSYQSYIPEEKLNKLATFSNNFKVYRNQLKSNLSKNVILFRSCNITTDQLLNILSEAVENKLHPDKIDFEPFTSIQTGFKFFKFLLSKLVYILNKKTTFQEVLSVSYKQNIYALFYSVDFPKASEKPLNTFLNILENRGTLEPNATFVAIKIDVLGNNEKNIYFNFNEATRLRVYKHGICVIDDYTKETTNLPDYPESWSLNYVQTQFVKLLNKPDVDRVPKGYVYVQYPGNPEPKTLWPSVNWQEITSKYAGLFFRAEGKNSLSFEKGIQDDAAPIIDKAEHSENLGEENIYLPPSGYSEWLSMCTGAFHSSFRFRVEGGEVRPKNMAIRIWRRST